MSMNTPPLSSDVLRSRCTTAVEASLGIVGIRCPVTEVYGIMDDIYAMSQEATTPFRGWTLQHGWCTYPEVSDLSDLTGGTVSYDPTDPTTKDETCIPVHAAFADLLPTGNQPSSGYFVMLDCHHLFTEPAFQVVLRNQYQRSYNSEQTIFMIIPDYVDIPEAVAPLIHLIDYEFPTSREYVESYESIVDMISASDRPDMSDDDKRTIARNALGMTNTAFETAISLCLIEYTNEYGTTSSLELPDILDAVRVYKTEILRKTEVLELQTSIPIDEIGGLDRYKDWMKTRKKTYEPEAIEAGLTPSRGAFVVGPPGTGKSLLAKATGNYLGLPVIRFDIGKVFGSYVGQSESKMRVVLKQLDAMAPIVLMIDEVDKGFAGASGSGGDSGTTQRVFGTFLTWMQERDQKERPVFVILSANRVDGLPSELLRRGRTDEIWSVNPPNSIEREKILQIHAKKRGYKIKSKDMGLFVELSERLTGAEIEHLVEQSCIHAYGNESATLNSEDFRGERVHLKPLAETFADDFSRMETWANLHARPATDLIKKKVNKTRTLRTKRRIH